MAQKQLIEEQKKVEFIQGLAKKREFKRKKKQEAKVKSIAPAKNKELPKVEKVIEPENNVVETKPVDETPVFPEITEQVRKFKEITKQVPTPAQFSN